MKYLLFHAHLSDTEKGPDASLVALVQQLMWGRDDLGLSVLSEGLGDTHQD